MPNPFKKMRKSFLKPANNLPLAGDIAFANATNAINTSQKKYDPHKLDRIAADQSIPLVDKKDIISAYLDQNNYGALELDALARTLDAVGTVNKDSSDLFSLTQKVTGMLQDELLKNEYDNAFHTMRDDLSPVGKVLALSLGTAFLGTAVAVNKYMKDNTSSAGNTDLTHYALASMNPLAGLGDGGDGKIIRIGKYDGKTDGGAMVARVVLLPADHPFNYSKGSDKRVFNTPDLLGVTEGKVVPFEQYVAQTNKHIAWASKPHYEQGKKFPGYDVFVDKRIHLESQNMARNTRDYVLFNPNDAKHVHLKKMYEQFLNDAGPKGHISQEESLFLGKLLNDMGITDKQFIMPMVYTAKKGKNSQWMSGIDILTPAGDYDFNKAPSITLSGSLPSAIEGQRYSAPDAIKVTDPDGIDTLTVELFNNSPVNFSLVKQENGNYTLKSRTRIPFDAISDSSETFDLGAIVMDGSKYALGRSELIILNAEPPMAPKVKTNVKGNMGVGVGRSSVNGELIGSPNVLNAWADMLLYDLLGISLEANTTKGSKAQNVYDIGVGLKNVNIGKGLRFSLGANARFSNTLSDQYKPDEDLNFSNHERIDGKLGVYLKNNMGITYSIGKSSFSTSVPGATAQGDNKIKGHLTGSLGYKGFALTGGSHFGDVAHETAVTYGLDLDQVNSLIRDIYNFRNTEARFSNIENGVFASYFKSKRAAEFEQDGRSGSLGQTTEKYTLVANALGITAYVSRDVTSGREVLAPVTFYSDILDQDITLEEGENRRLPQQFENKAGVWFPVYNGFQIGGSYSDGTRGKTGKINLQVNTGDLIKALGGK